MIKEKTSPRKTPKNSVKPPKNNQKKTPGQGGEDEGGKGGKGGKGDERGEGGPRVTYSW
jgi:hypothetical protein